jgi:hypothetical protein
MGDRLGELGNPRITFGRGEKGRHRLEETAQRAASIGG